MSKMRLTVLPVGQGTGTLIQVLDDNDKPIETIICDLGTNAAFAGFDAAAYVVQQLSKMDTPTLSAVFLSHGDSDHYNLITRVLSKFKKPSANAPPKEKLEVVDVWFGDDWTWYGEHYQLLLEYRLSSRMPPIVLSPHYSTEHKTLFKSSHGIDIYLILGNCAVARVPVVRLEEVTSADNSIKNTASLVLAVAYGGQWIILPGDATALTMAGCLEYIPFLKITNPVLSLSLPHHGSSLTAYALVRAKKTDDDYKAGAGPAELSLKQFVDAFRPRTVTVSSSDKHNNLPATSVIRDFGTYLEQGWWVDTALGYKQHFYTADYETLRAERTASQTDDSNTTTNQKTTWPRPGKARYYSARTSQSFFSTQYLRSSIPKAGIPLHFPGQNADFDAPPALSTYLNSKIPNFAGWVFTVQANGQAALHRLDEIKSDEHRAGLEAIYGALGPDRFVLLPSASANVPALAKPPASVEPAVVPEARTSRSNLIAGLGRTRGRPLP